MNRDLPLQTGRHEERRSAENWPSRYQPRLTDKSLDTLRHPTSCCFGGNVLTILPEKLQTPPRELFSAARPTLDSRAVSLSLFFFSPLTRERTPTYGYQSLSNQQRVEASPRT
ncbi:hypothetical protein GGI35DRAFT_55986 [Trichoderma velutinum]